jgi:hypothetical protein
MAGPTPQRPGPKSGGLTPSLGPTLCHQILHVCEVVPAGHYWGEGAHRNRQGPSTHRIRNPHKCFLMLW